MFNIIQYLRILGLITLGALVMGANCDGKGSYDKDLPQTGGHLFTPNPTSGPALTPADEAFDMAKEFAAGTKSDDDLVASFNKNLDAGERKSLAHKGEGPNNFTRYVVQGQLSAKTVDMLQRFFSAIDSTGIFWQLKVEAGGKSVFDILRDTHSSSRPAEVSQVRAIILSASPDKVNELTNSTGRF